MSVLYTAHGCFTSRMGFGCLLCEYPMTTGMLNSRSSNARQPNRENGQGGFRQAKAIETHGS